MAFPKGMSGMVPMAMQRRRVNWAMTYCSPRWPRVPSVMFFRIVFGDDGRGSDDRMEDEAVLVAVVVDVVVVAVLTSSLAFSSSTVLLSSFSFSLFNACSSALRFFWLRYNTTQLVRPLPLLAALLG